MEITAHARFVHMSPRKVRLVAHAIKGLSIDGALGRLQALPQAAVRPVRTLLESAVANAQHNHNIGRDALQIKSFVVNQGPALKRMHPRAMGRAFVIRKRTSHLSVVLATKQ